MPAQSDTIYEHMESASERRDGASGLLEMINKTEMKIKH